MQNEIKEDAQLAISDYALLASILCATFTHITNVHPSLSLRLCVCYLQQDDVLLRLVLLLTRR